MEQLSHFFYLTFMLKQNLKDKIYASLSLAILFLFLSFLFPLSAQAGNLLQILSGVQTSFRANISYFIDGDIRYQGKITYSYPNKIYVQFGNGDAVISNGKDLWLYDAASMLCAKQEVGAGSFVLPLSKYRSEQRGNTLTLFRGNRKITVISKSGLPVSVLFENTNNSSGKVRITFSNFQTGIEVSPSFFYYKPPTSAQIVENPFKKVK